MAVRPVKVGVWFVDGRGTVVIAFPEFASIAGTGVVDENAAPEFAIVTMMLSSTNRELAIGIVEVGGGTAFGSLINVAVVKPMEIVSVGRETLVGDREGMFSI